MQTQTGKYIQLPYPLTLDIVAAHLEDYRHPDRQAVTIGAYALSEQSQAKWVCFDADNESQWEQLFAMAQNLQNSGIPGYLEASRRGGTLLAVYAPNFRANSPPLWASVGSGAWDRGN